MKKKTLEWRLIPNEVTITMISDWTQNNDVSSLKAMAVVEPGMVGSTFCQTPCQQQARRKFTAVAHGKQDRWALASIVSAEWLGQIVFFMSTITLRQRPPMLSSIIGQRFFSLGASEHDSAPAVVIAKEDTRGFETGNFFFFGKIRYAAGIILIRRKASHITSQGCTWQLWSACRSKPSHPTKHVDIIIRLQRKSWKELQDSITL